MAWDATTSTLIFGENDAVLVDALTTVDEAEALARWIELHHRNLATIYVTHRRIDHRSQWSRCRSRRRSWRCTASSSQAGRDHGARAASTSLYVPSIDLVGGGDVFYNQCHMMVAASTPQSRVNWIADLDRLAALNPKVAVAGHKKAGTRTRRTPSRPASATSPTSAGSRSRPSPSTSSTTR
jgi:hypothetical protein